MGVSVGGVWKRALQRYSIIFEAQLLLYCITVQYACKGTNLFKCLATLKTLYLFDYSSCQLFESIVWWYRYISTKCWVLLYTAGYNSTAVKWK